jgi:hypothetical protein
MILKVSLVILAILGLVYLLWPTPKFPQPPSGALVSQEPADTESVYRKAFFTDLNREQVMAYYKLNLSSPGLIRLNLPPEDAQSLIRDQTRSNFLEELVMPGKETFFINGYYPDKPQDVIIRDGKKYAGKITIRQVPSHPLTRVTGWGLTVTSLYFISKLLKYA